MTPRPIRQWRYLFLLTTGLLVFGCAEGMSGIFAEHVAENRKARAKEQWESMRAGVKIQLAENHLNAGRMEEASKAIDEAIAMDPDCVKAYMLATRIEIERGELSRARDSVHTAMSYAYDDPEVRYRAGMVAERYDDLQGALEHYATASEAAPFVAEYVLARVEMLAALARDIDAIELLESRMSDFDGNAPMRALAAYVCRRLGLRGPAVDYGREALRLCPEDRSMKAELADTLVWAEEFDEAIRVLESLLNDTPSEPDAADPSEASLRVRLATAYLGKGRHKDATACLRPLIASDPANATAICLYARAAFESGDYRDAAKSIVSLHDNGRVTPESLMLLMLTQQQQGDNAAALTTVRKLIRIEGETATGYCLLGRALEQVGKKSEAREAYLAALRIDPTCAPARTLLARIDPTRAAVLMNEPPIAPETPEHHGDERTASANQQKADAGMRRIEQPDEPGDAVSSWMNSLETTVAAGTAEEGP